MITRDEFLAALDVVKQYRAQTEQQFREASIQLLSNKLSRVPVDKETRIMSAPISVRAKNVMWWFVKDKRHNIENLRSPKELKLEHFEGVNIFDFLNVRNAGTKTVEEIENFLFQAGINYTKVKLNGK